MRGILLKLLGGALVIFGIYMCFLNQDEWFVTIATLVMIAGVYFWFTSTDKDYNENVDNIKRVENTHSMSVEELFEKIKDVDTLLGKPWLSEINFIKGNCIVWGPLASGEIIYAWKSKHHFYVVEGEAGDLKNPEECESHIINIEGFSQSEVVCYSMQLIGILEDFHELVDNMVKRNKLVCPDHEMYKNGSLFLVEEDFKWTGQKFHLTDFEGNVKYTCDGTFPLKTFRIFEGDREIFKLSKKIVSALPQYTFYKDGEKYAKFKKKIDLVRDTFEMNIPEGKLTMKSFVLSFCGDDYVVRLNGKMIGTIAGNLNLELKNFVFNNYVIYVQDEKYLPLMTALCVMAVREKARDDAADQSSDD